MSSRVLLKEGKKDRGRQDRENFRVPNYLEERSVNQDMNNLAIIRSAAVGITLSYGLHL